MAGIECIIKHGFVEKDSQQHRDLEAEVSKYKSSENLTEEQAQKKVQYNFARLVHKDIHDKLNELRVTADLPKVDYVPPIDRTAEIPDIEEKFAKTKSDAKAANQETSQPDQQSQQQASAPGTDQTATPETGEPTAGEGQVPPGKPPVDDTGADNNDGGGGLKELNKLANNIPVTDKVAEYMSKETIEDTTGETPLNDQRRTVQELRIALEHGIKIIEKAKEIFGDDYALKTLEYIKNSDANVSNKALMYVSLENALGKEKLENPERAAEIAKLQAVVYADSQRFGREVSLALNYNRLRRIAEVGYDIRDVTDNFFSAEEIAARRDIEKAVEATPDEINKKAEEEELSDGETIAPDIEQAIKDGVEKEIAKIYEAMPAAKRSRANKAIAALEKIQKRLRSNTYDATLGIPVFIIDKGISVIKNAIKVGVKVADAIELGINKIKELHGKQWDNEDSFRKDYSEGFKQEGVSDELTQEERLDIAKQNLQNKIDNIREEIVNKKLEASKQKTPLQADQEYARLLEQKETLEKLRDRYLPKEGDPYADEKLKNKAIDQLSDDIIKLNEQIKNELKNPKEKKEDKFKQDADVNRMREEKEDRQLTLEALDPQPKIFVKNALVEAGFGREVSIITKNGRETRKILDWRKLATDAGSVEKIKEHVEKSLIDKEYRPEQILRMQDAFAKEYISLREKVISDALNDIAKKNKKSVTKEQKSASRKLAEMYAYGLFDTQPGEFETTLNKVLGAAVSEQGFNQAKKIAEAMQTLYASSFNGVRLTENSSKKAIQDLDNNIRQLLVAESKKQGNWALKAANFMKSYFDLSQTMLLNNGKQFIENPLSGFQQNLIENISQKIDGAQSKELSSKRRAYMRAIATDMALRGGVIFGNVDSSFSTRTHIDDYINKLSDNQLYHAVASLATGRASLSTMDAMFKASITEMKFTGNLIKILTQKRLVDGEMVEEMSKEDALKFVSEKLTGQSFDAAVKTATETIEKINTDAGEELIPNNPDSIFRFANDIVKSALEMGRKLSADQIVAAYNAAYKSAGLGLGHVANNPVSDYIQSYSGKLEGRISKALQEKEWTSAAGLTMQSIFFRNVMNPFVGGGTNWIVLKFEKAGGGLLTGLGYQIFRGKNSRVDLATEAGQRKLETALYQQARIKDNYMRGAVGGFVSAVLFFGSKALGDDEEYRKWRKKNMALAKYTGLITSEWTLLSYGLNNAKDTKYYLENSLNKNDAFSATTKLIKGFSYMAQGKKGEMWGSFGEAVGSKFNAPIPWRLVKDGQVIYQGVKGEDPYHGDYKASKGFWNGVFQGGVIEWLGFRPKK